MPYNAYTSKTITPFSLEAHDPKVTHLKAVNGFHLPPGVKAQSSGASTFGEKPELLGSQVAEMA